MAGEMTNKLLDRHSFLISLAVFASFWAVVLFDHFDREEYYSDCHRKPQINAEIGVVLAISPCIVITAKAGIAFLITE